MLLLSPPVVGLVGVVHVGLDVEALEELYGVQVLRLVTHAPPLCVCLCVSLVSLCVCGSVCRGDHPAHQVEAFVALLARQGEVGDRLSRPSALLRCEKDVAHLGVLCVAVRYRPVVDVLHSVLHVCRVHGEERCVEKSVGGRGVGGGKRLVGFDIQSFLESDAPLDFDRPLSALDGCHDFAHMPERLLDAGLLLLRLEGLHALPGRRLAEPRMNEHIHQQQC
mmetsp:Transcript_26740/g.59187  ORF Transcript_26740/g.59187 Transcript_26740/m.59187 type:complete len:222 (-) Transcript_26740:135-800(-)